MTSARRLLAPVGAVLLLISSAVAPAASAVPPPTATNFVWMPQRDTAHAGEWTVLNWTRSNIMTPASPINVFARGLVTVTVSATFTGPVRLEVLDGARMRPGIVRSHADAISFTFGHSAKARYCGRTIRVLWQPIGKTRQSILRATALTTYTPDNINRTVYCL